MITTPQGILAYSQLRIYLELYDLVDGMTEKLVDVVGFRRACIHCQGENTPTHWIGYETGEAVHTAYLVVIWTEPIEMELEYGYVNVINCPPFKWPNNMPAGGCCLRAKQAVS